MRLAARYGGGAVWFILVERAWASAVGSRKVPGRPGLRGAMRLDGGEQQLLDGDVAGGESLQQKDLLLRTRLRPYGQRTVSKEEEEEEGGELPEQVPARFAGTARGRH
mmetsp:Transcript_50313/g.133037  ORF Transcript_50313/g.133037 Transcript_50313/m.133037 type:complete len:108 (-) Transcript_50313:81-404(-)